MDTFGNGTFDLPELSQLIRVTVRLVVASVLGGLVGLQRQGKAAGLRTHMLVALGSALFTLAPLEAGMNVADLSRVFQGIATGIGFIGAGTILKLADREEIKGLTTAASIWLTAAIGMAVGSGTLWVPVVGVVLALIILSILGSIEDRFDRTRKDSPGNRA